MSIHIKTGDAWHTCASVHVNVSGTWHTCRQVYIKTGDAWHKCILTSKSVTKTLTKNGYSTNKLTLSNVKKGSTVKIETEGEPVHSGGYSYGLTIELTGCTQTRYTVGRDATTTNATSNSTTVTVQVGGYYGETTVKTAKVTYTEEGYFD